MSMSLCEKHDQKDYCEECGNGCWRCLTEPLEDRIRELAATLAQIERKAEAGRCSFTPDSKHVFLTEIQTLAAKR